MGQFQSFLRLSQWFFLLFLEPGVFAGVSLTFSGKQGTGCNRG